MMGYLCYCLGSKVLSIILHIVAISKQSTRTQINVTVPKRIPMSCGAGLGFNFVCYEEFLRSRVNEEIGRISNNNRNRNLDHSK